MADRRHLLENASAAFLAAVQRNMSAIRKAYGYRTITRLTANDDPVKGDRSIVPVEARSINRIFTDYVKGITKLGHEEDMPGAQEALSDLINRIVLLPNASTGKLDIRLEGDLAGLLRLAVGRGSSKAAKTSDDRSEVFDTISKLVLAAGVGNHRHLPQPACYV
ncbi:hypothetical protein [Qingshengfaniella alkalisoli]|uniref:hypothetical protein n=1 Tax=Qingshengfaniella alkalisoli TaxID=2599296 RepID=UPI00143D250B|nr:hypothetical protein [Qingshengfaniella alkalisoli]